MKKIITMLMAILLIFSFSVCDAAEINFTDVKTDDWFYKNLQELTEKNIISGYGDETFKPDNTLKFEEFIKMLVVATEEEPAEQTKQKEGQEWWQIYIENAETSKYINEEQKSLIGQNISRGTMTEILYNVLNEKEEITVYTDEELQYLSDRLTDIEKTDIKTLTINGIGIISGYPDGTFKPNGTLTRAEAVAVISRVVNPELRNPVKIVKRDANGVVDAKDLDKIPVAQAGYDINEQVQYSFSTEMNYKVENVIKVDTDMFPIRYGGLVITRIEKIAYENAPYYGDTSIAWKNAKEEDAIVIHGYPVEVSNDNGVTTGYALGVAINGAFVNKSGNVQMEGVAKMGTSYGGKAVLDKTKEMFPDYAIGDDARADINQQFTIMILSREGFELENMSKFILMDSRGKYHTNATQDILEIDAEGIPEIK
jgi:hypothetical protein